MDTETAEQLVAEATRLANSVLTHPNYAPYATDELKNALPSRITSLNQLGERLQAGEELSPALRQELLGLRAELKDIFQRMVALATPDELAEMRRLQAKSVELLRGVMSHSLWGQAVAQYPELATSAQDQLDAAKLIADDLERLGADPLPADKVGELILSCRRSIEGSTALAALLDGIEAKVGRPN